MVTVRTDGFLDINLFGYWSLYWNWRPVTSNPSVPGDTSDGDGGKMLCLRHWPVWSFLVIRWYMAMIGSIWLLFMFNSNVVAVVVAVVVAAAADYSSGSALFCFVRFRPGGMLLVCCCIVDLQLWICGKTLATHCTALKGESWPAESLPECSWAPICKWLPQLSHCTFCYDRPICISSVFQVNLVPLVDLGFLSALVSKLSLFPRCYIVLKLDQ